MIETDRSCAYCYAPLVRKRWGRHLETAARFLKRETCDPTCRDLLKRQRGRVRAEALVRRADTWASVPLFGREEKVLGWTRVDLADLDAVLEHRWHLTGNGYAIRQGARRNEAVFMHRQLLGLVDPQIEADHINRDRLDNRRANLRPVLHAHNQQNVRTRTDGTSRFRGVYRHAKRGKWCAAATIDGRRIYLGSYDREEDAAEAAAAFRAEHMPYCVEQGAA